MQLTLLLLIIVSLLSLLSGIAVLSGAHKGERVQAFLYFWITFFSIGWSVSIGIFLALPETASSEAALAATYGIYLPALLMSWGLAVYPIYKYKVGKAVMILYAIFGIALFALPLIDPSLLFSEITLSESTGNVVHLQHNLYNYAYIAYFISTCLIYMLGLFYNATHAKTAHVKKANLMALIGFTITGAIALIFDVILSFLGKYDTIWAGPLAMSFAWIFHYYAILRYRLIDLSGAWLKNLSHIIIMSLAAIVYLTIFFIIFIALFKVPSPSISVIILNTIMIAIVLILFPALNEISSYVRSLASVHDVDITYIVKKLNIISKEYINYHELADFLAEHLHFQYIGLYLNNKLYASGTTKLNSTDIEKLASLKAPAKGVWLPLNSEEKGELKQRGVEAVAILRDGNGEVVGKIIFGRPLGNVSFNNRNLNSIETALTLTAGTISAEKGPSQA